MHCISDIKHAFYINLDTRPDRMEQVEEQLQLIGIKATRFNAIKSKYGAIGCSLSHLKILETAKSNDYDHVLIVEDDILFTKPDVFITQFNAFLSNHDDFDVALLAGNNMPPYIRIDDTCVQVAQSQTTTGYLVKKHYYDKLIENIRNGVFNLLHQPHEHRHYAIDKYWFRLQEVDKWYLITPLTVTQRPGYSDIEKVQTNYSWVMLDLEKERWFKK